MSVPPLSTNAWITALALCRVAASSVSKTSAVPRPTAGRGSPFTGIARVISAEGDCAKAGLMVAPAASAAAGTIAN
jgi:hypothetical protein